MKETDNFGRTTNVIISRGEGNSVYMTQYEYANGKSANSTSNLISKMTQRYGSNQVLKYEYSYDGNGNVMQIKQNDTIVAKYSYDELNQLSYSMDQNSGLFICYNYDNAGNIISAQEHGLSTTSWSPLSLKAEKTYTYGDSNWKDKMTKYNGTTITYDKMGNPLNYRDGISMTWKNGRQLDTFTNGTNNVSYGYDSNSVRVSKTVDGVKYTYEYLNGALLYETRGEAKFWYSYDSNGTLYNIRYTLSDDSAMMSYYCTHNSRGDIVGIYNGDGVLRAQYEYDSWGNVISVTDENGNTITSATHVGNLNPFRYRGYYYDTESGFYYLMSRYYDPVTHRFINADGYFRSGGNILDANTFAYCGNNPIMYSDPNGEHSSSITCGDPTCTQCRPERRKFINENIDWYNRVTGSNYGGVSYTGEFWSYQVYETDKTSMEYKVVHSVAVFFNRFDIIADAGIGLEYKDKIGPVSFGLSSKAVVQMSLSGYDGFKFGTYVGNEVNVITWDFQTGAFTPWGSDINQANVGIDSRISIGKGVYLGAGASVDIGFNYGYFINNINEVWNYNG